MNIIDIKNNNVKYKYFIIKLLNNYTFLNENNYKKYFLYAHKKDK